jgi:hypothetical protein
MTRQVRGGDRRRFRISAAALFVTAAVFAIVLPAAASAATGELDCNGQSPLQHSVRMTSACTDIRGSNKVNNANTWDGRFYDNGEYIGHDEPDMTFLSGKTGSGNDVTWNETLPTDPSAAPTVSHPGSDVSHWFELSIAPWFSMAMCDSNSYPQHPCTPNSDANAPSSKSSGGGGAFMEMQFYPPGFAPFSDGISCDNSHWCSALTIDSLECTEGFATCNADCEEPVNFAFIQNNGVPTGPPSPQEANLSTETPNSNTLMMNPGDDIQVHMYDAEVPGSGAKAFKVVVTDLTTNQTGFMQASAANGFHNTSMANCSGTPHNFEPEYNTAAKGNIIPWAALATDISTQYETGHFEACTSVTGPGTFSLSSTISDTYYNECHGPYETAPDHPTDASPELSDAFCYPSGDTHGVLNTAPDTVTGCTDSLEQNGDLDFDGTPYWPEWPVGPSPTEKYPGSFVQSLPTTGGAQYEKLFIQTDLALSESTCDGTTDVGCSVPPPGPGNFYPYWTRVTSQQGCVLEFGNVSSGSGVNDYGKDAQYGTDQIASLGYPEYEGPVMNNSCSTSGPT